MITGFEAGENFNGDLRIDLGKGKEVLYIGGKAFKGCTALKSADLSGIRDISQWAFEDCVNLKTVNAPDVREIEYRAFHNCSNLEAMYAPNAEKIQEEIFKGCDKLTNLYAPKLDDIKINKTDNYVIFAKKHLEKEILENLKRLTGDENLSFESELKNNLGEPVKVCDEIKKYIEACGENLIQDLDSLSDKIDEYFFDYKINEPYYIENREELNEKNKDLEDVLKRVEELEKKILTAVETSANISENSKNTFKHILNSIFKEFKNTVNNILKKFKFSKEIDNTLQTTDKNKENTLDKEMKVELLKSNTITSAMLDRLACDSEISILRKVAKHENTSKL